MREAGIRQASTCPQPVAPKRHEKNVSIRWLAVFVYLCLFCGHRETGAVFPDPTTPLELRAPCALWSSATNPSPTSGVADLLESALGSSASSLRSTGSERVPPQEAETRPSKDYRKIDLQIASSGRLKRSREDACKSGGADSGLLSLKHGQGGASGGRAAECRSKMKRSSEEEEVNTSSTKMAATNKTNTTMIAIRDHNSDSADDAFALECSLADGAKREKTSVFTARSGNIQVPPCSADDSEGYEKVSLSFCKCALYYRGSISETRLISSGSFSAI